MLIDTNLIFNKWLLGLKDKEALIHIRGRLDKIRDDNPIGKVFPIGDGISEIKLKREKDIGYISIST